MFLTTRNEHVQTCNWSTRFLCIVICCESCIGLKVNHRLHHHYSIQKFEEFYVENLDCCSSSFPTCFLWSPTHSFRSLTRQENGSDGCLGSPMIIESIYIIHKYNANLVCLYIPILWGVEPHQVIKSHGKINEHIYKILASFQNSNIPLIFVELPYHSPNSNRRSQEASKECRLTTKKIKF